MGKSLRNSALFTPLNLVILFPSTSSSKEIFRPYYWTQMVQIPCPCFFQSTLSWNHLYFWDIFLVFWYIKGLKCFFNTASAFVSRSLIFGWQFNQSLDNVKLPKTLRDLLKQESWCFFQGNTFGAFLWAYVPPDLPTLNNFIGTCQMSHIFHILCMEVDGFHQPNQNGTPNSSSKMRWFFFWQRSKTVTLFSLENSWKLVPSLKLTFSHLKKDGWKMNFLLWRAHFQGLC